MTTHPLKSDKSIPRAYCSKCRSDMTPYEIRRMLFTRDMMETSYQCEVCGQIETRAVRDRDKGGSKRKSRNIWRTEV